VKGLCPFVNFPLGVTVKIIFYSFKGWLALRVFLLSLAGDPDIIGMTFLFI